MSTTEADRTVVSLFGEHDLSTASVLSEVSARALDDDADVVIDLSGVAFMDASTIDVILHTKEVLHSTSRKLTVRAPSPFARFLLELCQLSDLVDAGPVEPTHVPGALASWIRVPVRGNHPVDRIAALGPDGGSLDEPTPEDPSSEPGAAASPAAEPVRIPWEMLQDGG